MSTRSRSKLGVPLAGLLLLVACGSSGGTGPETDSGPDGSSSGADATKDTSSSDGKSHPDTGSGSGDGSGIADSSGDSMPGDSGGDTTTTDGGSCAALGPGKDQFNAGPTCNACLAKSCCSAITTCVGNAACL